MEFEVLIDYRITILIYCVPAQAANGAPTLLVAAVEDLRREIGRLRLIISAGRPQLFSICRPAETKRRKLQEYHSLILAPPTDGMMLMVDAIVDGNVRCDTLSQR